MSLESHGLNTYPGMSVTALVVGNAVVVEEACAGGDGFGSRCVVSLEAMDGLALDGLSVLAVSCLDRRCGADGTWVDGRG